MLLLPWPLPFCTALYPFVFVPFHFERLPHLTQSAILAHEKIHHRQQKKLGLLRFCWYYAWDKPFRWRIEQAGYQRQLYVWRKAGYYPNPALLAQKVSGTLYKGMVSYEVALLWFQQQCQREM